jgi:hypothetical protein
MERNINYLNDFLFFVFLKKTMACDLMVKCMAVECYHTLSGSGIN